MNQKPFFIVNPNSANGQTGKRFNEMKARIERTIGTFDFAFTERSGHATRLAEEACAKDYDCIIAIGGDGTNNEVINGFFADGERINPDCAFGFICRGTGGDFRKTFGWTTSLDEALARIQQERRKRIDVGRFTYFNHKEEERRKYFLNITSFGMGGLVDYYVNSSSKILGGKASFMIGTFRALLAYRNKNIRLKIDDGEEIRGKFNLIAIANGRFFGGGMMMAPEAQVDDGLFDIITIGDISKAKVIAQSSAIYKGTHIDNLHVKQFRGKRVKAFSEEGALIDMDGEQPGRIPSNFEILASELELLV